MASLSTPAVLLLAACALLLTATAAHAAKTPPAAAAVRLIDEPDCPEIRSLCSDVPADAATGDLQRTLECVQTFSGAQLAALSDRCQHTIWRHTLDFMADQHVHNLTATVCAGSAAAAHCGHILQPYYFEPVAPGRYLACMLDYTAPTHGDTDGDDSANSVHGGAAAAAATNGADKSPQCAQQLQRIELVAFTDFRLLGPFVKACSTDVIQLNCGRFEVQEGGPLAQGETLACLQRNLAELSGFCRPAVMRLSEVQADNVRLDRQLFVACKADAGRLCGDLRPGSGAVYR